MMSSVVTKRTKKRVVTEAEILSYRYGALANFPVNFAIRALDFHPESWQETFLRDEHRRLIMLCPRGAGKSLLTAIIALHHSIYTPNAFTLMFSKSERQSMELFKKTIDYYHKLDIDDQTASRSGSAHKLELLNGSRILSLPSSIETVIGYHDVTLLIIDEAALVKDEFYQKVRPELSHQYGRLILLSTPQGRRGFFFEEWHDWLQNPDTVWHGTTVGTIDCPHMGVDFLLEEKLKLGDRVYRSEYECSFEDDTLAMFKSDWLVFYDPVIDMPLKFDVMIQSWDPTSTKTATSDFCVGQVWGRSGADMYLLDQVRGRWDFDETVEQIKQLSEKWPMARAKIIEAQSIGAGLSSHIKNLGIPGVIPIPATEKKEMRALSVTPYFQAHNVLIPKLESRLWVREYLNELLNFPNVTNDDMVDATSQAINRLQNTLFEEARTVVADTEEKFINPTHHYRVGWIPARIGEHGVLVVYNYDTKSIIHFERMQYGSMQEQMTSAFLMAQEYDTAIWAESGIDEALLKVLIQRGTNVKRVNLSKQGWTLAYENLSLLINYRQITIPDDPELLAELDVFKSEVRFDGQPDYSVESQSSGVRAICLVTYDVLAIEQEVTPRLDEGNYYFDEFTGQWIPRF